MFVDVAPIGSLDYAMCNWWGSNTGPENSSLNPSGTGDIIDGDLIVQNFSPLFMKTSCPQAH